MCTWYLAYSTQTVSRLTAREITSIVVFMPNITTNHAIIYKNQELESQRQPQFNIFKRSYFFVIF